MGGLVVVCVLSASWSQLAGWPPPSPHFCEESAPILINYPSMTWADKMPSLIVTSVTPPCQGLLLSQYVPNSSVPPFSSLLPLSFFWGEHLSKTGLIFALISNLKRLLTPESLAFSSFFPWSAG